MTRIVENNMFFLILFNYQQSVFAYLKGKGKKRGSKVYFIQD